MTTTDLTWQHVYHDALAAFQGQTPGRQLEADLVEAFEERPATVQAAIAKISDRYRAGKIHTPWPLVKRELEADQERATHKADAKPERDKAAHLAELYIQNAGLYLPTESELVDALFGPHGTLKLWADDELLKARMLKLWRDQQPRAQAADQDRLDRARRFREARERMTANPPPPKAQQ